MSALFMGYVSRIKKGTHHGEHSKQKAMDTLSVDHPAVSRKNSTPSLKMCSSCSDIPSHPKTQTKAFLEPVEDLRFLLSHNGHSFSNVADVRVDGMTCKGFLFLRKPEGNTSKRKPAWKLRWVVLDISQKTILFFSDQSESKIKGGIYFQNIEHFSPIFTEDCPNPEAAFCLKSLENVYYLCAKSIEGMALWLAVLRTAIMFRRRVSAPPPTADFA